MDVAGEAAPGFGAAEAGAEPSAPRSSVRRLRSTSVSAPKAKMPMAPALRVIARRRASGSAAKPVLVSNDSADGRARGRCALEPLGGALATAWPQKAQRVAP